MVKKDKPLGRKADDSSDTPRPEWDYYCIICFKRCSSSQSLAGHQQVHKFDPIWQKGLHHVKVPKMIHRALGSNSSGHVQPPLPPPPPVVNEYPPRDAKPPGGSGVLCRAGSAMGSREFTSNLEPRAPQGFKPRVPPGFEPKVPYPTLDQLVGLSASMLAPPVAGIDSLAAQAKGVGLRSLTGSELAVIKSEVVGTQGENGGGRVWKVPKLENGSERASIDLNVRYDPGEMGGGVQVPAQIKVEKVDQDYL